MTDKYIFTFWEPENKKPAYLKLCMETWQKYLPDYKIIKLNFKNLNEYLPKDVLKKIIYKKIPLPQQADCIRAWLLHLHGGFWFDCDTILTDNKIIEQIQKCECCMTGNENTRSNIDIGFIFAKKDSKIIKQWAEEIPNRVSNYKKYRRFKLFYQLFNYKEHKLRKHWGYFGHYITDEIIQKSTEKEIHILDRDLIYVYLENNLITDISTKKELGNADLYRDFYFNNHDYNDALSKNKGIIYLHNSWTPKEYKNMTEEDFLKSNTTLSNLLKEILNK